MHKPYGLQGYHHVEARTTSRRKAYTKERKH